MGREARLKKREQDAGLRSADGDPEGHGDPVEVVEERALAKVPAQQALAPGEIDYSAIEALLQKGDLSALQPEERAKYILTLCKTLQLNPMTKPFDFLTLNGKLMLYINRNATDQLRKVHRVNLTIVERGVLEVVPGQPNDVYTVKAHAALPDGRTDESVGAVSIKGKAGEDLANAVMRCETKAKRRVTLSILGLSFTDESELDTINYVKPSSPAPRQIAPPQQAVAYHPQSAVRSADVPPGGTGTSPLAVDASARPAAPVAPPQGGASAPVPPPVPTPGWGTLGGHQSPRGGPLPPPRPATPSPIQGITFAPQGGTPTPAVAVVSAPPARPSGRPQPKRG